MRGGAEWGDRRVTAATIFGSRQPNLVANLPPKAIFRVRGSIRGYGARQEKLIERFRSRPRDFRWDELVRLLNSLGYEEVKTGRTGGSRRRFVHPTAPVLSLHEPHPGNIVKLYVIESILQVLLQESLI